MTVTRRGLRCFGWRRIGVLDPLSTSHAPIAMGRRPTIGALRPGTLSSGPESGLVNQLFALMGYAVMAHDRGLALVLPNFTTHDNNGTK